MFYDLNNLIRFLGSADSCLLLVGNYGAFYDSVINKEFFLCRREAAKGNKNKTKKPTIVPVPGKSRFSSQKNGINVLIPLF